MTVDSDNSNGEFQQCDVSLLLAGEGVHALGIQYRKSPVEYDCIRIFASIQTDQMCLNVHDLFTTECKKSGVECVVPLSSHGRWVIDLDALSKYSTRSIAVHARGRKIISSVEAYRYEVIDAAVQFTYSLEWVFPQPQNEDYAMAKIPPGLVHLVDLFKAKYKNPSKCAFVMMRFDSAPQNAKIFSAIEAACLDFGFTALRADSKEFTDDLFHNVQTYMYACAFGIAVFERVKSDDINPNVSLEVGFMYGLGKSICLLKDATVDALQSDLVGKLYRPFDSYSPNDSIKTQLETWLRDKDLIS